MPQIKVLNNLLLAKLLKNFRWLFVFALIHELLNKSINLSKVFKFVFTLFNLQGTDIAASLSLTAFRLYHSFFRLSRTFFKFFQAVLKCFESACCSLSNFAMLAHRSSFVKNFFQILSNFVPICCFVCRLATTCIY